LFLDGHELAARLLLADQRFYSFRRDGNRSGRFASLIWIAN